MKTQSKILFFSFFTIFSSQAMEQSYGKITQIKASSLFAPNEIGKVDLFHDDEGYHVVQDDEVYTVNKHSVDPLLRSLKHKQLKKFQKCGYIHVKKNQDNEFSLVSKIRGNGGGPYFGWILYTLTKSFCYGAATAAVGAGVAATTPVLLGAGASVAGGAGATLVGSAIGGTTWAAGTALASTGAGAVLSVAPVAVIAGGLSATATGTAAATGGTALVLATYGTAAIAAVETASCAAFALGTAIPFLP